MLEPTNRREELRNVDEFKMIGLQLKILDTRVYMRTIIKHMNSPKPNFFILPI